MELSKEFNALFDSVCNQKNVDQLVMLKYRWLDEHEHEDWNDYVAVMKGMLPPGNLFVKASKRPFGVTFKNVAANKFYSFAVEAKGVCLKSV